MTMTIPFSNLPPRKISLSEAYGLPPAGKLEYFDAIRPGHPNLIHIRDELELVSRPLSGSDLILLVGPTGVGKSTAVDSFFETVMDTNLKPLQSDLGFMPIIKIVAPSSGDKAFSWLGLYGGLCRAAGAIPKRGLISTRYAAEEGLRRRRTGILIIDEAVNMIRHTVTDKAEGNIEVLKSFGSIPGLKFVLVGSYDLLDVASMKGQVARRAFVLHFPRYRRGVEEDERAFRSTFHQLMSQMPIEGIPDLDEFADDMMIATVGCIGILKETLTRALNLSLGEGGEWKMEHLGRALLTPLQLNAVLSEVEKGEKDLSFTWVKSGPAAALVKLANTFRKMEKRG